MNELELFQFDGHELRKVYIDGEAWHVVADYCKALGIQNATQAVNRLDQADLCQTEVRNTRGEMRPMWVANQEAILELIFKSDKPQARALTRYFTHVVIPAGMAALSAPPVQRELSPRELAALVIAAEDAKDAAIAERDQATVRAITAEREVDSQAELLRSIHAQHGDLLVGDAAKYLLTYFPQIGLKEKDLRARYKKWRWMEQRKNAPMAAHMVGPNGTGRFTYRRGRPWIDPQGKERVTLTPTLTPKGLFDTAKRLLQESLLASPAVNEVVWVQQTMSPEPNDMREAWLAGNEWEGDSE